MEFASSVPFFKTALINRLQTVPALANGKVTVSRGHPYPKRWANDSVLVGGMSNYQQRLVCSMTQRRETYDVEITANASGAAQDPYEDFEARAYQLAAAVETSLTEWTRTGETLTSGPWGLVSAAIPEYVRDQEGLDQEEGKAPKSRDCTVYLVVHVTASVIGSG